MQRDPLMGAETYTKQNNRRRIWQRIVGGLACVVVFCTTYALILPAITQEREAYCGYEEHTHDASCYTQTSVRKNLVCTPESLGVHKHDKNCYDSSGNLVCEVPDRVVHSHNALCYDEVGQLVCQFPEVAEHEHTEECYAPAETQPAVLHVHTEECYGLEQGDLVCELEEKEGHAHGDACYISELTCTLEVKEGHAHGTACYTVGEALKCTIEENHAHGDACYTSSVTCGKEEDEEHTHDSSCYTSTLSCTIQEGHVHSAACHEQVLTCVLPEEPGHAHTESCYVRTLTCELPEEEGHTHEEACYTWNTVTVCGLEEGEEEPVPETEPVLICEEPVLDTHTHSEEKCFETVVDNSLTCTLEENEEHAHTELCYGTWELTCGLEEHTHELTCYSNAEADVETEEDWLATFADVELTGIWAEDVLLIAESQLGYTESVENYVVWEDGTTHGYTRYGEWYGIPHGDWCGMFVSFCLNYAGVEGMPFDFGCRTWIATLSEEEYDLYHVAEEHDPQPGELIFFDWEGDDLSDHVGLVAEIIEATDTEPAKIKTIEGNSSNKVQYVTYELDSDVILGYGSLPAQLTEEEQAEVDYVIQLIDEMPSADEIDAEIEEFEEAEDYEGEEAWLTKVYRQVSAVYAEYDKLSDTQKAYVTNADKLLELEYIWSATTYAATNTIPVYQINSYYPADGTDPSGYAVIMLRGGSFDELCQRDGMLDFAFNYWDAIVVEEDESGNLYIAQYDVSTADKSALAATTENGFVLIFTNDSTHEFYLSSLDIKVGDYVTVDFAYTSYNSANNAAYNDTTGEPYGYVTFSTETVVIGDNPVTIVKSASTSEFIELNLYDYYGDASASTAGKLTVNSLWKTSSGTYTGYPGFQWNGGAYAYYRTPSNSSLPGYTTLVDRNVVDNIDFGNSKITDYDFEAGSYGDKSASAQSVGWSNSDAHGAINRIIYYPSLTSWGLTNRPIGMSTLQDPVNGTIFSEVLERTLNSSGYPQLKHGTYTTGTGSLDYLFSESRYAKKINGSSIDGLFQYDENSGAYYYNSRENHAQYNSATNSFTLYNQIITPNFILYPFGNFLPFNDITDGKTASLVGRITVDGENYGYDYTGGGAAYIAKIMNRLVLDDYGYYTYDYTTDEQLYNMLEEYKTNWNNYSYNGTYWSGAKTSTFINDFFNTQATKGESPNTSVDFSSGTNKNIIDKMYNIDFNVEKNFFFGMDMKMSFYQPKDGMTGKDKDGNGTFDYPMEFYFTGDDDVWVYIDNILFLDLSGIHRHVGGKIDFVNGRVYYQYLNIGSGGDVSDGTAYAPYGASYTDGVQNTYYTFAEILTAGGIAEEDLGNYLKEVDGEYTTFLDYSTHSFKFYYMERGSGSSVCRLNFNFPLIQQNSITVEKELDADDVEVLGDPDFTFQVADVDDNGNKTTDSFFGQYDEYAKWAYSLYDANGTAIQKLHIVDKNPDGSIKTLEVYQGNLLVMKEEFTSEVIGGTTTSVSKRTYYNDAGFAVLVEKTTGTGTNAQTTTTYYTANGVKIDSPTDEQKKYCEGVKDRVLTTDEEGKFTLKAGQKAEFVGIAESWGEYYVREILPDNIDEQYGEITVTGETETTTADKVKIGESEFVGADSTIENSTASNSFKYTNKIDRTKLGSLSITKTLNATYSGDTSKEFAFNVTLDGELLPAGLSYSVTKSNGSTETRNVCYVYLDADGNEAEDPTNTTGLTLAYTRIKLYHGETATISNILAGTKFVVTETEACASGYAVAYTVNSGTVSSSGAEGTIEIASTAEAVITNSEIGTSVEIPVTKKMSVYGSSERTFTFVLQQVADKQLTAVDGGYKDTVEIVFEKNAEKAPVTSKFVLNYLPSSIPDGESSQTYYYTITEKVGNTEDVRFDDTVYLVEVTVTKSDSEMTSQISGFWTVDTDGKLTEVSDETATFTNTLVRNLILQKTVSGSQVSKDKSYRFEITFREGLSHASIPAEISGVLKKADGTTESKTYTVADGKITVELSDGESLKLSGIPYLTEWTVTELDANGFTVTYTVTAGNSTTSTNGTGTTVSDKANAKNTTVAFTNTQLYALPETGGAGTHLYTMAGLMLMLFSGALLLYRTKKRRREAC